MLVQAYNPSLAGRHSALWIAALTTIMVPLLAMVAPAPPVEGSQPRTHAELKHANITACISFPSDLSVSGIDDKTHVYTWSKESYTVEAQVHRKVGFPGMPQIQVDVEGSFVLTEWSTHTTRKLMCAAESSGLVNQRYWVNGQVAPFDAEAHSWLEDTLYMTGLSDDVRYIWTTDRVHYDVRQKGQVIFAEAEDQILVIPEHGYFVLQEQAERTRSLKAVRASGGSLSFTFTVDGQPQPFEATAQAWLADVLPEVIREMRSSG